MTQKFSEKFSEKEWLEDFKEFVSAKNSDNGLTSGLISGALVPDEVSNVIRQRIFRALHPSAWIVFAKLSLIHLAVGTLNLAICNQFGVSPFQTNFSLSDYFMRFGHSTCMVLCGLIFISLSVILCRLLLKPEEFRVFSKNAPLQVMALSVFSLVSFLAFGAEITLGIGLLWLLGALSGGLLASRLLQINLKTAQSV